MNKINLFVILSIVAATTSMIGLQVTPALAQDNMSMGMANMDNMSMPMDNMDNMTMGMDNSTGMSSSTPPMQ